jgi:hypothetical protein
VLSSRVASVDARRLAAMIVPARSEREIECVAINAGALVFCLDIYTASRRWNQCA